MNASSPDLLIPIYRRSDAAQMAADLVGRFWLPPMESLGFSVSEMRRLGAAIAEVGHERDAVGGSGLNSVEFALHVHVLMKLLVNQSARSAPDHVTSAATGRAALQNALFIMLAAPPSSPVREAMDSRRAMNEALRPQGLAWFSRRRLKERLEEVAPDVRAAHADLVASTQQFLADT